jgi:hypothetical protein
VTSSLTQRALLSVLRWFDWFSRKALKPILRAWLQDNDSRWRVKACFRIVLWRCCYSYVRFFTKDVNKEHEVHLSRVYWKELHRCSSIDLGVPYCQFCDSLYAHTVLRVLGEMCYKRRQPIASKLSPLHCLSLLLEILNRVVLYFLLFKWLYRCIAKENILIYKEMFGSGALN